VTIEIGPAGPNSEVTGTSHENERSGSSSGVDSSGSSVTVMEVLTLVSTSLWHIEKMSMRKQCSEVLMSTPRKVMLEEVTKRKRNSRSEWEDDGIKKEKKKIEKEREI
jgi:hypothetical protein